MSARRGAVIIAGLLSAAPVRAEVKAFPLGPGPVNASRDGYHFAPGSAELSDDGKIVLDEISTVLADGRTAVSVTLNGKTTGGVYDQVMYRQVAPHGGTIAYAAHDAAGWAVHSSQGVGPSLPTLPSHLFVSETEVAYLTKWQNRTWLYRNGVPSVTRDYTEFAASPEMKLLSGVYVDEAGYWVETNGVKNGPWKYAQLPVFSDDERHYAFLARKSLSVSSDCDTIVVDGTPRNGPPASAANHLLVDNAGIPYWIDSANGTHYRGDSKLPPYTVDGDNWVFFSPSAAHFALWDQGRLIVDGRAVSNAPQPVEYSRIVFDGEKELHYVTKEGGRKLICASIDGSSADRTRCARVARAMEKASSEP